MARILLGLAMVLAIVGCNSSVIAAKKPLTAQSVALQPGDVIGLQRCDVSGDFETVLQDERTNDPVGYRLNTLEWERWRTLGATQAYFAVYGRTAGDCADIHGSGRGAPSGGLIASLVVKFKSEPTAARIYRDASTLLGFGPKDLTFIRLAGGKLATGTGIGLGQQSEVGSASVAGTTYYIAFWHKSTFDSYFIAYDVESTDAQRAVESVNKRMSSVA